MPIRQALDVSSLKNAVASLLSQCTQGKEYEKDSTASLNLENCRFVSSKSLSAQQKWVKIPSNSTISSLKFVES